MIGLEPDPATAPALLAVTQQVAEGGSLHAAARWLEAQGIRTPTGNMRWELSSLHGILRNPSNCACRASFRTHNTERPNAARREVTLRTTYQRRPVPLAQQYVVDPAVITPLPGLTRDLWQRAVARLADNQQFAARRATLSEAARTERALLHGGAVRCAGCGHGLRVHPLQGHYIYTCSHSGTPHQGQPSVNIQTRRLDGAVWQMAVSALRDPDFLTRLTTERAETDALAIRAASLTRQLADVTARLGKLFAQLETVTDVDVIADYQQRVKARGQERTELEQALAAVRAQQATETTRQARLEAFRQYAAQQTGLDGLSRLEQRRRLLALRARAVVAAGRGLGRVSVTFDVRPLPGATAAFAPEPVTETVALAVAWDGTVDLRGLSSLGIVTDEDSSAVPVSGTGADRAR